MSMRLDSRIHERSVSGGTGAFIVVGALLGHMALSTLPASSLIPYAIEDKAGNWEEGLGTTNGSTTLNRTFVTANSLGTQANINFPAGTVKDVVLQPDSGCVSAPGFMFGDGSDGDVTISGTVSLPADTYYRNLTFVAGAALNPATFTFWVSEVMDMTQAPAGAISRPPGDGGSASGMTAGSAGAAGTSGTVLGGGAGGAGVAGNSGSGNGLNGSVGASLTSCNGGGSGASGAGGAGNGGAGGGSRAAVAALLPNDIRTPVSPSLLVSRTSRIGGGVGAPSGGSGGSPLGSTSGGSGGGGGGGRVIAFYARVFVKGLSTSSSAIKAVGGNGGNGGNGTVDGGGGGGSGGGGGGWIYAVIGHMFGPVVSGLFDVTGGTGGTGGNAAGAGTGGTGGGAGGRGRVTVLEIGRTVTSTTLAPTAGGTGTAAVGTVGGAGGVPVSGLMSL